MSNIKDNLSHAMGKAVYVSINNGAVNILNIKYDFNRHPYDFDDLPSVIFFDVITKVTDTYFEFERKIMRTSSSGVHVGYESNTTVYFDKVVSCENYLGIQIEEIIADLKDKINKLNQLAITRKGEDEKKWKDFHEKEFKEEVIKSIVRGILLFVLVWFVACFLIGASLWWPITIFLIFTSIALFVDFLDR